MGAGKGKTNRVQVKQKERIKQCASQNCIGIRAEGVAYYIEDDEIFCEDCLLEEYGLGSGSPAYDDYEGRGPNYFEVEEVAEALKKAHAARIAAEKRNTKS